jgi:hypothetical protein
VTIIVDDFQSSVERNCQNVQKLYQQDRTLCNGRDLKEDNVKGKRLVGGNGQDNE